MSGIFETAIWQPKSKGILKVKTKAPPNNLRAAAETGHMPFWLHVNIPKVRYSDMGNKAE